MGHTRLGELPKSRKWKAVVASMAQLDLEAGTASGTLSEHVEILAQKTLDAAQAGLEKAIRDTGLQYTFYLLTQVALAAREDNWEKRLAQVGIHISNNDSLFDLTAEIQNAIDDYIVDPKIKTEKWGRYKWVPFASISP